MCSVFSPPEPPVVTLPSSSVTAVLGEPLTITPTITFGVPTADVTWSVEGQGDLDLSNSRYSVSSEGVLTVTNVVANDAGRYTVRVTNIGGPDSAFVDVFVNCKLLADTFFLYNQQVPHFYPSSSLCSPQPCNPHLCV